MSGQPVSQPIELFYCYAHRDERLRKRLETHLSALRQQGVITEWHDRKIVAGTDWKQSIDTHLITASIILLLISPDFLASDYCYGIEMQRALARHAAGDASVIPVILRPVDWQGTPFAHLQCVPTDAKPVTKWASRDEAFRDVAMAIRVAIEQLHLPLSQSPATRQTILAHSPIPISTQAQNTPSDLPELEISSREDKLSRYNTDDSERGSMLDIVRNTWIEGALEPSLYGASLIVLRLREDKNALKDPRHRLFPSINKEIPAGTRISEVYDNAARTLLILGKPGAGKTTLLLELARDLLNRAVKNENHRIPVVFNLSSWASKKRSIEEWLIEELMSVKYHVPPKTAETWIRTNKIVPLLDGLDEIPFLQVRSECIAEINNYHHHNGFLPIVICCRTEAYYEQSERLDLNACVVVQPLTSHQIDGYLSQERTSLLPATGSVFHDESFKELLTSPLWLSMVMLTYQNSNNMNVLQPGSKVNLQDQVMESYIQHMLKVRTSNNLYSLEVTRKFLTWLAQKLKKYNNALFFIEEMQLHWIRTTISQNQDHRIGVSILMGLIQGIVLGFVGFITYGFSLGITDPHRLSPDFPQQLSPGFLQQLSLDFQPLHGLSAGIVTILLNFLIYFLINGISFSNPLLSKIFGSRIIYGSAFGLPNGCLFLFFILRFNILPLYNAIFDTIVNIVVIGIVFSLIGKVQLDIYPAEVLSWSLKDMKKNFVIAIAGALLIGLSWVVLMIILSIFIHSPIPEKILYGLTVTIGSSVIILFIMNLSTKTLKGEQRNKPNQGIRNSLRNAIFVSSFSFVLVAAGIGFSAFFFEKVSLLAACILAITYASLQSFIFFMLKGGVALILHMYVRIAIWSKGYMPLNYPKFLDYAADHILLRKVGGGYIFIHPLLRDYLANKDINNEASSSTENGVH